MSDETFLAQLRRVNTERYNAWVEGDDAGIMFDALELGGEVGELLNVVKKLEREERGWRGSRAAPEDFADECADVMICLDKLARRRGVDLQAATIAKFNATSDKVGLPHRLSTPSPDSGERMREAEDAKRAIENRLTGLWSWLESISTCDWSEIVADGGITAGMVVQQEASGQRDKVQSIIEQVQRFPAVRPAALQESAR